MTRKKGKPFIPGDVIENRTVLRVVAEAERLNDWQYRVRSTCCGFETPILHSSLRRIETQGDTKCRNCGNVKGGRKRSLAMRGGLPKSKRRAPAVGTAEWALHQMARSMRHE